MSDRSVTTQAGRSRLDYLDGLRGIASLVVVIHHFRLVFCGGQIPEVIPGSGWNPSLQMFFMNGGFAVAIFFVLSGFVLSQSSDKGKSTLPARLLSRYLRLTLPMLASLLLSYVLLILFTATRTELQTLHPTNWMRTGIYGATVPHIMEAFKDGLYRVYLAGHSAFNNVVWTMRTELIGSVMIYLIYWFRTPKYRWAGLIIFLAVAMTKSSYLGFPIGALLREAWVRGWLRDWRWAWLAAAGGLTLGSIEFTNFIYYCLGAGLLVASIFLLPALRKFLSTRVPVFLGRISFALYLVHLPLIFSIVGWVYLHLTIPLYPKTGITFIVLLIASITTAWLMTVALDEPLLKQLRRIKTLDWSRSKEKE